MSEPGVQKHPLARRLSHWSIALAVIILIGSGWRIHNNVPIVPFSFPLAISIGGDPFASYAQHNESGTANAIAWHFAAMWLLAAGFLLAVIHGVVSGHFRRDLLPVSPASFLRDFIAAATFRLDHRLGEYNAVQKVFYWGVFALVALMLASGLAIWTPVPIAWLASLFGGFDFARIVHFTGMSLLTGFIIVHLALVALVPSTLVAMITGEAREHAHPIPQVAMRAIPPEEDLL